MNNLFELTNEKQSFNTKSVPLSFDRVSIIVKVLRDSQEGKVLDTDAAQDKIDVPVVQRRLSIHLAHSMHFFYISLTNVVTVV